MVNQRRTIAPRPTPAGPTSAPAPDMEQIMAKLSEMEGKMTNVEVQVGSVKAQLNVVVAGNASAIRAIGALGSAHNTALVNSPAIPVAPVALLPVVPTKQTNNDVYTAIRKYMWKPKFSSRITAEILANNNKPRWNTDVPFNQSPNKELVVRILNYLEPKFESKGMRRSDLHKNLHTNFRSQSSKDKKSSSAKAAVNTRSRRANRAGESHSRRLNAYLDNEDAINEMMGKDCANMIIREAMSEGESDVETSESGTKRVIRTVRPGWRSDEFNRLITIVDSHVLDGMGLHSHQFLPRVFKSVSNSAAPNDVVSRLPQWAFRNDV
ncbi:hypothetical protein INT47_005588 [Mucor saturninus]|uniref:Uncharacterized protein n=1 Tax=Mucor saturninus TaxID=64648 RepID=A0A8H7USW1_9FUNG|nr:hypothetical protein INT47_005588 [Mucor saturninus]